MSNTDESKSNPNTPVSPADMIAAVEHEIRAEVECGYEDDPELAKRLAAMRAVLATLSAHSALIEAARLDALEQAAQVADTACRKHLASRDDNLRAENEMGALTQARQGQTANHIAERIRALAAFPAPASQWRESKEETHRRFYEAFHDWFKNDGGCDFWSECDAPEALATIAVELHDKIVPPSTSDRT